MALNNPRFAATVTAGVTHPLEADITHSAPVTTTVSTSATEHETFSHQVHTVKQWDEDECSLYNYTNVLHFLLIVVTCVICSINAGYSCYSFRNIRVYHCGRPKRLKCGTLHVCILYFFVCFRNLISAFWWKYWNWDDLKRDVKELRRKCFILSSRG